MPNQMPGGPTPGNIAMLTSDVSLLYDPVYRALIDEYRNLSAIEHAFSHAWYKLTTAGGWLGAMWLLCSCIHNARASRLSMQVVYLRPSDTPARFGLPPQQPGAPT